MPSFPSQKVLLLIGPAGAGKTSLGRRIAQNAGWVHISEDDVWVETKQNHSHRTPEGRAVVEPRAVALITAALKDGKNVVFDFLVYQDPPVNLTAYQALLKEAGAPVVTRILRPTADAVLARKQQRGRPSEKDLDVERRHTENQIRCLHAKEIDPAWVLDTSDKTLEETYRDHFASLVAPPAAAKASPKP